MLPSLGELNPFNFFRKAHENADTDNEPSSIHHTLGKGPMQAAKGNHGHSDLAAVGHLHTGLVDSDWVTFVPTAGVAPFASAVVTLARYRKIGQMVHVRLVKNSTAIRDLSASSSNFANVDVVGAGSVPAIACPVTANVTSSGLIEDTPSGLVLVTDGSIVWSGGFPRSYPSGATLSVDFVFFTTA